MTETRTPAQVLREARRRDSHTKRARVLAVVDEMLGAEEPITFTTVAKAAGVSHWLVYADGVREHIERARRQQSRQDERARATGAQAGPVGARIELEIVREDNRRLRAERDKLRAALQRGLGQQLDQLTRNDLGTRVDELAAENAELADELAQAHQRADELAHQLAEAQDDLAAARLSLRRMIRAEN